MKRRSLAARMTIGSLLLFLLSLFISSTTGGWCYWIQWEKGEESSKPLLARAVMGSSKTDSTTAITTTNRTLRSILQQSIPHIPIASPRGANKNHNSHHDTTTLVNKRVKQSSSSASSSSSRDNYKPFHFAVAPAFFGFYGYFGALAAWEQTFGWGIASPSAAIIYNNDGECEDALDNNNHTTACDSVRHLFTNSGRDPSNHDDRKEWTPQYAFRSVVGGSAGAMVAILIAAGVTPQKAADFCSQNITLQTFADFPGSGSFFRGNRLERVMEQFLRDNSPLIKRQTGTTSASSSSSSSSLIPRLVLEKAILPVAVSAFDLLTSRGIVLERGSMARAARASATFPFLFQPVRWSTTWDNAANDSRTGIPTTVFPQSHPSDYTLVDGGVDDMPGWMGVMEYLRKEIEMNQTMTRDQLHRIVHLQMGYSAFLGRKRKSFHSLLSFVPPGPIEFQTHFQRYLRRNLPYNTHWRNNDAAYQIESVAHRVEVISIVIHNLPQCGPWALRNGPVAVAAAREAMINALDQPMIQIRNQHHYILHIDTSPYW